MSAVASVLPHGGCFCEWSTCPTLSWIIQLAPVGAPRDQRLTSVAAGTIHASLCPLFLGPPCAGVAAGDIQAHAHGPAAGRGRRHHIHGESRFREDRRCAWGSRLACQSAFHRQYCFAVYGSDFSPLPVPPRACVCVCVFVFVVSIHCTWRHSASFPSLLAGLCLKCQGDSSWRYSNSDKSVLIRIFAQSDKCIEMIVVLIASLFRAWHALI